MAELHPNHIQFHYGQYKRADLIEAAHRSRACAYLADDDHGSLALQEILLAGCPTVGVRRGASFVRQGVTGVVVERLPPGQHCVAISADQAAFSAFIHALDEAKSLDRRAVRSAAAQAFDTTAIADNIIASLESLRVLAR